MLSSSICADFAEFFFQKNGAKFVCFEGADKLPNGYYGTCIGIDLAMDPTADVIVAFEQNGMYVCCAYVCM